VYVAKHVVVRGIHPIELGDIDDASPEVASPSFSPDVLCHVLRAARLGGIEDQEPSLIVIDVVVNSFLSSEILMLFSSI
jgi:hypothetical protein